MDFTLKSWDGNLINNGTAYASKVWRVDDPMMARSSPVYSSQIGAPPMYTTKGIEPVILPITISVMGTSGTLTSNLFKWFDSSYDGEKKLVVTDSASKDWFVYATPIGVVERISGTAYKVALSVGDFVWQSDTLYGTVGTITTAAGTVNVVTNGNMYSRPDVKLTPTAGTVAGYVYSMFIPVYQNPSNVHTVNSVTDGFIDIFNASFPGSALVAAGRAQADGDDVRIFKSEVEVNRILKNWNTGTAECWIPFSFVAPYSPPSNGTSWPYNTVSGSVSAAATVINFTASWYNAVTNPSYYYMGSEVFYGSVSPGPLVGSVINVLNRGMFNTTAGTLASGGTIYPLPAKVMMYYGNPAVSGPTIGTVDYPLFDYTLSNNSRWVYTQFVDTANPTRPAAWGTVVAGAGWRNYNGSAGDSSTNPADVLGIVGTANNPDTNIQTAAWLTNTKVLSVGTLIWSGQRYRPGTVCFNGTLGWSRMYTNNGGSFVTIGTPTVGTTWENYTGTVISTTSPDYYLGVKRLIAGNFTDVALDITAATITFAYPPVVGTAPAGTILTFGGTLTNGTTGDNLSFSNNQTMSGTVDINTDTHNIAYITGGSVNLFPVTTFNSYRPEWFKLLPGTNPITWTQPGTINTVASITWRDRQV